MRRLALRAGAIPVLAALAACGSTGGDDARQWSEKGEERALSDAAAMLDDRRADQTAIVPGDAGEIQR